MKQTSRKILFGCLTASLSLHILGLCFFQRYSLWFSSPQKGKPSELTLVDKQQRDQILKTAFEPVASHTPQTQAKPHKEQAAPLNLRTPTELPEHEPLKPLLFHASTPSPELLTSHPFLATFPIPSAPLNLLDYLPKDLLIPAPTKQPRSPLFPIPSHTQIALANKTPAIQTQIPESAIVHSAPLDLPLSEIPPSIQSPHPIPLPHLPTLPTLAELETSSYSDSFDADLVFLPKEGGTGYIFALTLIPRPDLNLPRIRQHLTFLIDRSNSIQQGRLSATKSAIHKALEELSPSDTFNIIAFDSKVEKLSPNPLPCIGPSFAQAEAFLEKIQLGSFFSSSDLCKSLLLTVPGQVAPDELYTAILFTDGETLAKKNVQKALLHDWTHYNQGKVTLYTIAMSSDPHLGTLDAASFFNKGKLSNAPTHRGLKRKLLKLMKTIDQPIAKNLACKAIHRSPQAHVQLFPKTPQLPPLYLDQPYVILGETDSLDDFILFVQGRLKDQWMNIKKTISFLNAKKGNKSLKQEWALQQAYGLYERYVREEDPKLLAQAETLLEPFASQVAFK